ncbi:MAG: hypothetical protein JWN52_5499 [Actinomycetia bacterium]|nr:hypothetical protein [Actinomycetes bacterium]
MRSFRAELLRSINRSTAAFALLCVGFTLFSMANAGPQHHTPLWGFQQVGIFTATLLMGRAAVVSASDFSAGTIRPWLISQPSRRSVFTGKLAGSVAIAVAVSVLVGLISFALSGVFGSVPSIGDMAVATGQLAFACTALSFFGHAVGVLTRSVPVALTITLVWILPGEKVMQGHSAELDRWLPGGVLQEITLGKLAQGSTPLGAALHSALPFVLLDLLALGLFFRRDVNS